MNSVNEEEIFEELRKDDNDDEIIQSNQTSFSYGGKNYRIIMPNQFQLTKAKQYKYRCFAQLVKEGSPLQKNWIKTLKEQDVDIEQLRDELRRYHKELVQLSISEAKTKDSEKKTRAKLDTKLDEIESKMKKISDKIADNLAPTAEAQANEEYYRYLTAECTEVLVDEKEDKWERVWDSWKEHQKDQSNLPYMALGKVVSLIYY